MLCYKPIRLIDLYEKAKSDNKLLLSDFNADFWNDYIINHARYDKIFNNLYSDFIVFHNTYKDKDAALDDFIDNVYNHLLINNKKYSELYRIHTIPDDSYSVVDNYDMTETFEKESSGNNENIYGQKTKTIDTTLTDVYGAKNKTITEDIGGGTDVLSFSEGSQESTSTDKVSPYDTESFFNEKKNESVKGTRQDTTQSVIDERQNITSEQESSKTDTHSNDASEIESAHTDTSENASTESYTLRRKGNIGVSTSTDVMEKAKNFWSMWDLYAYIFGEIAKELLYF